MTIHIDVCTHTHIRIQYIHAQYIHAYIYTYIQSYILTYFGILIHIGTHTYIHSILAYIPMYMYVCLYMYVCICMHVYVCMYMYVCICVYVCVYVCICMRVCMYICVCIHVYVCMHNIWGNCSGVNVLPKTGGGIVRGKCPGGIVRGELSYTLIIWPQITSKNYEQYISSFHNCHDCETRQYISQDSIVCWVLHVPQLNTYILCLIT